MATDDGETQDSGKLIDIQHISGRSLWCWKYVTAYTYDRFDVRTQCESCNARMLEIAPEEAAACFGKSWPVFIIMPVIQTGEIDYPPVRITAFFTSMPISAEMHLSSLVVIWFQKEQWPVPDGNNFAALAGIEWDRLAVDYET